MSFFNGLKKAFGFGEDDLDEEVEGIDARVTPYRRRDEAERSQEDAVGASADASVSLSDAARDAAQPHAADSISHTQALNLFKDSLEFIKGFEGQIPGTNKEECGNYLEHDLEGAKSIAIDMLEVLKDWNEDKMYYEK